MSKHKKPQQKNLSLKERLAKHWDNGSWDLFTALFSRNREASMRTPFAGRWHDALYNSLTQSLIADKDLAGAEAVLDLINGERGAFGVPVSLGDCADVASDFLRAHRNAFLRELSPLGAESGLPAAYASLREGLASFVSSGARERKFQKDSAAALAEKYAAQYASLGRARSLTPYTTWLKIAERLEQLADGTGHEQVFRAVRAITALVRELFRTGNGVNSMRKIGTLLDSKLFRAIPQGQTHPAVKALWNYFCSTGERKYGSDWGDAARVAQISFMADENLRQIKAQYGKLLQSGKPHMALVMLDLIRDSSAWTEQELYILHTIFADKFEPGIDTDFSVGMQFVDGFGVLARIGRKWRPEAPWPDKVQESFTNFLYSLPADIAPLLLSQIPYDAVSPYNMVVLSLMDTKQFRIIEKNMQGRLPFRFDERALGRIGEYLASETLPRWTVRALDALAGPAGRDAALAHMIRSMIDDMVKSVVLPESPVWQAWEELVSGEVFEEIAALLPRDSLMGCFCRLCSGMEPFHVSGELSKTEAFFEALVLETNDMTGADIFLVLLLTWHDAAPELLIRLFRESLNFRVNFCGKKDTAAFDGYLFSLSALLQRMPDGENKRAAALGILKLVRQVRKGRGSKTFNEAAEILNTIAKSIPPAARER